MPQPPTTPELLALLRAWCQDNAVGLVPSHFVLHFFNSSHPVQLPFGPEIPVAAPRLKHQRSAGRHSPDFRSLHWNRQDYIFTPAQAAVVRQLYEAWEEGPSEVGQETLLEKAGSESSRLRDLFKDHPAWGVVIVACGKGLFRLAEPRE